MSVMVKMDSLNWKSTAWKFESVPRLTILAALFNGPRERLEGEELYVLNGN